MASYPPAHICSVYILYAFGCYWDGDLRVMMPDHEPWKVLHCIVDAAAWYWY